jgi:excisionase family DNA binding protein
MNQLDRLVTASKAAELSGYTVRHIGWLCREGRIEAFKMGWMWLIDRESLMTYLQSDVSRSK